MNAAPTHLCLFTVKQHDRSTNIESPCGERERTGAGAGCVGLLSTAAEGSLELN